MAKDEGSGIRKLPHSLFDSQTLSRRRAFSEWTEQVGSMGDVRVLKSPDEGFHVRVEAYLAGDLAFGSSRMPAQIFDRSRLQIARDGVDHYALRFYGKGGLYCRRNDEDKALRPEDLLITDLAEMQRTAEPDTELLWLVIPRAHLAPRLRHPEGHNLRVVPGDSALVRLLHDHLSSLFSHAPSMTVNDVPAVTDSTLALAAAAINGSVSEEGAAGVQKCMVDAICRYVRDHAGDPGVTADTLAARFGISRRKLSYLFEELGGAATYIQSQRLHLARRRLADPAMAHRTIAEVAAELGFSHRASFTRAFERVHGISPRQVRVLAKRREAGAGGDGIRTGWHHWLTDA